VEFMVRVPVSQRNDTVLPGMRAPFLQVRARSLE
jgi:hypothetical protein